MVEEMYWCNKCGCTEWYSKDSEVWCSCSEVKKNKMKRLDDELQKILREELKINRKY